MKMPKGKTSGAQHTCAKLCEMAEACLAETEAAARIAVAFGLNREGLSEAEVLVVTLVKWLVGAPVAKPLQTAQQQQIRTVSELQQPGCLWIRLQSQAEVYQLGRCFLQQKGLLSLSKSLVELQGSFNYSLRSNDSLNSCDLMHGFTAYCKS